MRCCLPVSLGLSRERLMQCLCFQERSDATVMLLTVWQQATCVSLSLVPASPDFSILRTPILHSPTAAWTHSQAQQTSAEPNRPKTTLALPCPLWNAVTKTCAITEDCMTSSLLPRAKPQVGPSCPDPKNCLIYRPVTAATSYVCY